MALWRVSFGAFSLTPGDRLFEPMLSKTSWSAASHAVRQSIVLDFARAELGESNAYRWRADGVDS